MQCHPVTAPAEVVAWHLAPNNLPPRCVGNVLTHLGACQAQQVSPGAVVEWEVMPRKKRDIKNDYRAAGFSERQGKGDHTVFSHPLVDEHVAVDGRDGDDAYQYDEQNLRRALKKKRAAERRPKP